MIVKLGGWRSWLCLLAGVLFILPAGGCAKNLIFSTYTTLGVELKGNGEVPTCVRLAYKRFEGAIIPVDPSTDEPAHSVLASIDAEQSLWEVRVNQVFATGGAAERAADAEIGAARGGKPGPMAAAVEAIKEETP